MKKRTKAKKRKLFVASRRGVIVVALIAVLVLVINLITASYSWFTPQEEAKRGMSYSFSGKARSESCTMTHYSGHKLSLADGDELETGQYWGQMVYFTPNNTNVTLSANEIAYFKTEILNSDENNASDISLYIKGLKNCTLAVTYPGNSVRKIAAGETADVYIVRNAYVKRKDNADVNGPGKLEIEWFVIGATGGTSFDLNNVYLLYN